MKISELLKNKQFSRNYHKPITIAFLGDSVTQGCFENYTAPPDYIGTVDEYKNAYSTRVREILNILYPSAQVNIINSGIAGNRAEHGLERLERDVLCYQPDLVVVSFGLNDSVQGLEYLPTYKQALLDIFSAVTQSGAECVFLTQNSFNTKINLQLTDRILLELAEKFADNNDVLREYFTVAKSLCADFGVKVCDLHATWERLTEIGVNTTELLSNKLNHPIREWHYYIAMKLIETILL